MFAVLLQQVEVIEFQKRGLPHSHLLLIMAKGHKPKTPDDVNARICAEFPDATSQPVLHEVFARSQTHGPCGARNKNAPCMRGGVCDNKYPKNFVATTVF